MRSTTWIDGSIWVVIHMNYSSPFISIFANPKPFLASLFRNLSLKKPFIHWSIHISATPMYISYHVYIYRRSNVEHMIFHWLNVTRCLKMPTRTVNPQEFSRVIVNWCLMKLYEETYSILSSPSTQDHKNELSSSFGRMLTTQEAEVKRVGFTHQGFYLISLCLFDFCII